MFYLVSEIVDISPCEPVVLGCGPLDAVPPTGDEKLEANLIYLRDADGFAVLIISIDALYVGPRLRNYLDKKLSQHLEPRQILIAATHTHNAPQLDDTKPKLGMPVQSHLDLVFARIADAAERLVSQEGVCVVAESRSYRVRTVVTRRWRRPITLQRTGVSFFTVQSLPHPVKPKLTSEVLEFRDANKRLVAVIWVMPCHPTSLPNLAEISSHFIGKIRDRIREEQGDKLTSVAYLQGASGDLRPPAYSSPRNDPMEYLRRLARGKVFDHFSPAEFDRWVERVYSEYKTAKPLNSWELAPGTRDSLTANYAKMPLGNLYQYEYDRPRFASCQVVSISGLQLVAVSAEPTWAIRKRLLGSSKQSALVGCIDDTFGYFPTPDEFYEGGYEATGFYDAFSLKNIAGWTPLSQMEVFIRQVLGRQQSDVRNKHRSLPRRRLNFFD